MRGKSVIANSIAGVACAILLLPSCSGDSPTGTTPTASPNQGTIDPTGQPSFSLGTTPVDGVPSGRVEVWGSDLQIESESVVSFDISLINRSNTALYAPVSFVITDINPPTVQVLPPDSTGPGDSVLVSVAGASDADASNGDVAVIDFSNYLGDDSKLDPGEQSSPVRIRFDVPGLTSFSIGYRVEAGPPPTVGGSISGVVFFDSNQDGEYDPAMELGVAGRNVGIIEGNGLPSGVHWRSVTTDAMGRYRFDGLGSGIYKLQVYPDPDWIATTPNPLLVTLVSDENGNVKPFEDANFGFFDPSPWEPLTLFHADVGPGLGVTEVDTVFVNPEIDIEAPFLPPHYTLVIGQPVFIRATPQWVAEARVWINDEPVWEFECPDTLRSPPTTGDCVPEPNPLRVELPGDLIPFGENTIRIIVKGGSETFLIFAVERSLFWAEPQ